MGKMIELTASDGHKLAAYRADPAGGPRGGIVVIQEIFGVNSHVKSVADGFAADGYLAIAPAMFDRAQRNFDVGYTPPDIEKGRALRAKITLDMAMKDSQAAVKEAAPKEAAPAPAAPKKAPAKKDAPAAAKSSAKIPPVAKPPAKSRALAFDDGDDPDDDDLEAEDEEEREPSAGSEEEGDEAAPHCAKDRAGQAKRE